jgi:hypothetical protein
LLSRILVDVWMTLWVNWGRTVDHAHCLSTTSGFHDFVLTRWRARNKMRITKLTAFKRAEFGSELLGTDRLWASTMGTSDGTQGCGIGLEGSWSQGVAARRPRLRIAKQGVPRCQGFQVHRPQEDGRLRLDRLPGVLPRHEHCMCQ